MTTLERIPDADFTGPRLRCCTCKRPVELGPVAQTNPHRVHPYRCVCGVLMYIRFQPRPR